MNKIFSVVCLSLMWVSLWTVNSFSADTDSLVVNETGYVGIGTTDPVYNLEINGDKNTFIRVRGIRQDSANASGIQLGDEINPKRYSLNLRGTNKSINGDFKIIYNALDTYWAPFAIMPTEIDAATYNVSLHNNDVYIDSAGKVGIGTTDPQEMLDVVGLVRADGDILTSDIRWKEDIQPIDNALERVTLLRGVNYEWIDKSRGQGLQLGVIAQEVEEIFPEVVHTDSRGFKSVEYSKLVAPLIEAVKELNHQNEDLQAENARLKNEIVELRNVVEGRLAALESALARSNE